MKGTFNSRKNALGKNLGEKDVNAFNYSVVLLCDKQEQ